MRAVSRTVASQVQWKPDHSVARIRSYVPGASNLSYIGRHLPTAHLGHHVLPVGEVDALTWGIIAVVNPPDDLRDVLANELRLLDPAVRRSRDAMLRLLHEDFRKVGASGRAWDRDALISALAEEIGDGAVAAADQGTVANRTDRRPLGHRARDGVLHPPPPLVAGRHPPRPAIRSPAWRRLAHLPGAAHVDYFVVPAARRVLVERAWVVRPRVHGRAVAENSPMA